MKRKVIQLARKTLVVSLPSKWAELYKIRKGDEVNVEAVSGAIIISTERDESQGKKEIQLRENQPFLKRYLRVLYQQGYNEVVIKSDESLPFDKINDALGEMLGFEIIENKEKYCLIKNIAKGSEEEFDVVFKRLFYVTLSMARDIASALKEGNLERLKQIKTTEKTVDKIANFCARLLNTRPTGSESELQRLHFAINTLENVGDNLEEICTLLEGKRLKVNQKELKLFEETTEHLQTIGRLWFKTTAQELTSAIRTRKTLLKIATDLMEEKTNTMFVHYLLSLLEKGQHLELSLIPATL
ncbi:MAG: PhoU domain-containing protein [Candidatus Woesearchaeota archaeon]